MINGFYSPDFPNVPFPTGVEQKVTQYESLNDYQKIETVVDGYPANYVIRAKKISNGEVWYLALRHGEYSAQVDKAASDVFRKYVPGTPVTSIVKEGDDFYLASKEVDNKVNPTAVYKEEVTPWYFGSISVLAHFLGESDRHSNNVIISSIDDSNLFAHKIDSAESLDEGALQGIEDHDDEIEESPKVAELNFGLEEIFDNHWAFPSSIVNHFNYNKEQIDMLNQIGQTEFEEIAGIIKNVVHASKKHEVVHFLKKLLKSNLSSEEDKIKMKEFLEDEVKLSKVLDHTLEIDDILKLLQNRHERYKQINEKRTAKPN